MCQTDVEEFVNLLRSRNSNIDGYSKLLANIKSFVNKNLSLAASDMVKQELQVARYELRVTSYELKA